MSADTSPADADRPDVGRRKFISRVTGAAMAGGLLTAYGSFGSMAGRFLYPAKGDPKAWLFVAEVARIKSGESLTYVTPTGATVAVARQASSGGVSDFIALSSTCPHLGCKVHWEQPRNRFFCPCHNGTFNPVGAPTGGPPLESAQSLPRYPLKIEKGLLYIETPIPGDAERRGRDAGRPV